MPQILVHGEKHQMMRLKFKLLSLNADKTVKVKVYTPANCDEVRIPFKKDKVAKVVGTLAQVAPPSEQDDGQLIFEIISTLGFSIISILIPVCICRGRNTLVTYFVSTFPRLHYYSNSLP